MLFTWSNLIQKNPKIKNAHRKKDNIIVLILYNLYNVLVRNEFKQNPDVRFQEYNKWPNTTLLRFTESTGNVNYDIIQNNKSSKMLINKVISDCHGYENIKLH